MARKETNKKKRNRSSKAGLNFPVGRINSRLRRAGYNKRVSATAPVFLAAILEYIASEMLELSHDQAFARDKRRVSPCDIFTVIRSDSELNKLFDGASLPYGGTIPGIRAVLLPP
jgi:histone H2A